MPIATSSRATARGSGSFLSQSISCCKSPCSIMRKRQQRQRYVAIHPNEQFRRNLRSWNNNGKHQFFVESHKRRNEISRQEGLPIRRLYNSHTSRQTRTLWVSSSSSSEHEKSNELDHLNQSDQAVAMGVGSQHHNPWSGVSAERLEQETNRLEQYMQMHQARKSQKQQQYSTNKEIVRLDDYYSVLEAWMEHAKHDTNIHAARIAESLLKSMEQGAGGNNNSPLAPTLSFYEVVLQAYAVCRGGIVAAQQAQAIVEFLFKHSQQRLQPTTKTMNILLNAWAKSGHESAGPHAEAILQHMMTCPTTRYYPNARTIVTVMDAWNKSRNPVGHQKVTELMEHMMRANACYLHENYDDNKSDNTNNHSTNSQKRHISLDIAMFHATMESALKHTRDRNHVNQTAITRREAAELIESILQSILDHQDEWKIKPNVRTFSIALDAWARVEQVEQTGEAAQRAQRLLDFLLDAYYGKATADHDRVLAGLSIRPNTISFASVIVAWSHVLERGAALKAQDAWDRLTNLFHLTNDTELLPTAIVGNTVLTAWAKEGHVDRIMLQLKRMQELAVETGRPECRPDLRSFNILLGAFGKAGQTQDAVALLQWMEGPKEALSLGFSLDHPLTSPDLVSYNSVLKALAHDGNSSEAEALLLHMRNKGVGHDNLTYTSMMNAYARSKDPEKVAKAQHLLQTMTVKSDSVCIVAFIQVCATAEEAEQEAAISLAKEAFAGLPPQGRNSVAFLNIARVVNRLMVPKTVDINEPIRVEGEDSIKNSLDDERIDALRGLAEECCEAGYLSDLVYREFCKANILSSGTDILAQLKGRRLEARWSRNVGLRQKESLSMKSYKNRRRRHHHG